MQIRSMIELLELSALWFARTPQNANPGSDTALATTSRTSLCERSAACAAWQSLMKQFRSNVTAFRSHVLNDCGSSRRNRATSRYADPPAEFMAVDIGAAEVNSTGARTSLTSLEMAEKPIERARHAKRRAGYVTLTRTLSVMSSPRNTA